MLCKQMVLWDISVLYTTAFPVEGAKPLTKSNPPLSYTKVLNPFVSQKTFIYKVFFSVIVFKWVN